MPQLKCKELSNVLQFDIKRMHFSDQRAGNDREVGGYPAGEDGISRRTNQLTSLACQNEN